MQMLEALTSTGQLTIEQRRIGAADLMSELYGTRRFEPAWTDPKNVEDLIAGIKDAANAGLSHEDFHLSAVTRLRSADGLDATALAGRDILFTDALVRLGYQPGLSTSPLGFKRQSCNRSCDSNLSMRLLQQVY